MIKKASLLIAASLLCACVATKPVATSTLFQSEWSPELTINIPKGFTQLGPYIIKENKQSGLSREEYYPYVQLAPDGSLSRIISISILSLGHRKQWTTMGLIDAKNKLINTDAVKIQDMAFISGIATQHSLNTEVVKRIQAENIEIPPTGTAKVYFSSNYQGLRVIIDYIECNSNEIRKDFHKWKELNDIGSVSTAQKEELKNIEREINSRLANFKEKADNIFFAQTIDEIPLHLRGYQRFY